MQAAMGQHVRKTALHHGPPQQRAAVPSLRAKGFQLEVPREHPSVSELPLLSHDPWTQW